MGAMIAAGRSVDAIVLRSVFGERDFDHQRKLWQYIGDLTGHLGATTAYATDYARTIIDLAARRAIIIAGEDAASGARETSVDSNLLAHIEIAQQRLDVARQDALGQGAARSNPISVTALANSPPPREWLIEGIIPNRQVTLFSGEGGIGKSLIGQQLATSAVLGRIWLGNDVKRCRVLYLNAEDENDELHRRMVDIAQSIGVTLESLEGLHLWSLAGQDAVLATADERNIIQPTPLYRELDRRIAEIGVGLIWLDPLISLFPVQESNRAQARGCISLLRSLAMRHNAAVVLSSHPSLSGMASRTGSSGSTDWCNAVRSRMFLERIIHDGNEPDETVRTLRINKTNYGPKGGKLNLRWHGGVFTLDGNDAAATARVAHREAQVEQLFLDLMDVYASERRHVVSTSGGNYAPTVFAYDPRAKGFSRRELRDAMNRLFAATRIKNAPRGSGSRQTSQIVRFGL